MLSDTEKKCYAYGEKVLRFLNYTEKKCYAYGEKVLRTDATKKPARLVFIRLC